MAKNTGIERSKKNPIELERRTWRIAYPQSAGSFIICFEHRYAVVLLGFSGHDATFSLIWSRDLCDWFPIYISFQFEQIIHNFIVLWLKWLKWMHFRVYWTKKVKHVVFFMDFQYGCFESFPFCQNVVIFVRQITWFWWNP
jgi:hypothetical protein